MTEICEVWILLSGVNRVYCGLKSCILGDFDDLLTSGSTENLSCRIRLMQQPGAQFLDNLFCSDGTMG
jgi:hypothetical protein